MAAGTVKVEGLRELQRALSKVNKEVAKDVRGELKRSAEPVRALAESNAFGKIRNIGPSWGRMKIGTRMAGVYLAPATRRKGGSARPNLGRLLMFEAMLPAVNDGADDILKGMEDALDRLGNKAGF